MTLPYDIQHRTEKRKQGTNSRYDGIITVEMKKRTVDGGVSIARDWRW